MFVIPKLDIFDKKFTNYIEKDFEKSMNNKNNVFSRQGADYFHNRPDYPIELIQYLSSLCNTRKTAWDVGTGNGQVAIKLSSFFEKIIATDIAKEQIENAIKKKNINYCISSAENSKIEDQSINLITGGQVAPWLKIHEFYSEAKRVAEKNCIIALFGFREVDICKDLNILINNVIHNLLNDYWPGGKQLNDNRYSNLPFPFEEIKCPQFTIVKNWNPENIFQLIDSYSGGRVFFEKNGYKVTTLIKNEFIKLWGDNNISKIVKIPIYMRVGIIR